MSSCFTCLHNLRYGFLLSENNVSQDPLSISAAVLQQFNIHPDMYQVGYTKLYFRTGQVSSFHSQACTVIVYFLLCKLES